jgi:hypothetical protein
MLHQCLPRGPWLLHLSSSLSSRLTHVHQCSPSGFWFVHVSSSHFHGAYSLCDLVVGLFICFSLPHSHHRFLSCYPILKVGLFNCFSLPLVTSARYFRLFVLISWLGCSRFSLLHVASLLSCRAEITLSTRAVSLRVMFSSLFTLLFCCCVCSL